MIYMVECALTTQQSDATWDRWYHSMKPPHILPTAVPGISTTQRFKGTSVKPPAYFAMYSVTSADVMTSDAYRNAGGGRFQTERFAGGVGGSLFDHFAMEFDDGLAQDIQHGGPARRQVIVAAPSRTFAHGDLRS